MKSLRVYLRDQLGTSWQIRETKGKARLGIRFEDGSITFKYLPYKFQRKYVKQITQFIESVHDLHIRKGVPVGEAFDRVKALAPKESLPKKGVSPEVIMDAWKKWGKYKLEVTGDISKSTWEKGYSKTERKLEKVADSEDGNSLLIAIGEFNEPGSRSREESVQRVSAFLRWATSKDSEYLLNPDIYSPPPKFNLSHLKGRKSRELAEKTNEPTPAILDSDIFRLLDSLDENHPNMKGKKRKEAKEWSYVIELMMVYGLRPIETKFLELRKNGKTTVWCTYAKKSGGGIGKPRRLFPLSPELEKKFNLINRIKNKEPLPKASQGVGEGLKNYFRNNEVWKELNKQGIVFYSFRNRWAYVAHREYGLHPRDACVMMGHTLETHMKSYSRFITEDLLEESFDKAVKRKSNEF